MMIKIDKRGFTLVELLAVIVILGIIAVIMIPSVTYLINENKTNNLESLEDSIVSAAKIYMSDNRYDVSLVDGDCDSNNQRNISSISGSTDMFIGSGTGKLKLQVLIDSNDLTDGLTNPQTGEEVDTENSYIIIKYNCETKDYDYESPVLIY